MELMHRTHAAPRIPLAPCGGGANAHQRRRPREWLRWVTGVAIMVAVGLTTPQPAAACWYCGIVNAVENIGEFFKDLAIDLVSLTENVVTLDPVDAFYDLVDVFQDVACPAISGFAVIGGEIAEALKNDNCDAPHGIAPEVLAKLSPYFNSSFDSVVIHENCDYEGGDAITFGEHIYFRRGGFGFRPMDASGQVDATGFATLAHELVHVLQYRQEGFADFTCKYAQNCGLGAWIAGDSGVSCALEQQAYVHQVLVFEDVQRDGDGMFTCVPDDQEWDNKNFHSHTCDGKELRDNCPDVFNPGQEDADGDGIGDACERVPTAKVVHGDFNGDGKSDLALTGPSIWYSVPVAFSDGNGVFQVTNSVAADFAAWAAVPNVQVIPGDFNHDGRTDLALLPGPDTPWWYTLPVAFSKGDGTFTITNAPAPDFAAWVQVTEYALP